MTFSFSPAIPIHTAPLTADQAVKMALELRPDLKQLRLALKTSELQERVARHQSLPDLSVTASGGFSGVAGAVGSTYQQIGDGKGRYWSAGVQLSVPIGNTAASNDYRKSKIRTEQAQNQIRIACVPERLVETEQARIEHMAEELAGLVRRSIGS